MTGSALEISEKLWGSWIFLAGSPWYSEAEEWSEGMKEEAMNCLTARACCLGQDFLNSMGWSCL